MLRHEEKYYIGHFAIETIYYFTVRKGFLSLKPIVIIVCELFLGTYFPLRISGYVVVVGVLFCLLLPNEHQSIFQLE